MTDAVAALAPAVGMNAAICASLGVSRARLLRETLPELVPAGLVALYYYQFGRWQGELGPESPLNIWLIALSHGVFSPAMAWFRPPGIFFSEMEPASRWLAAAGEPLPVALPWKSSGPKPKMQATDDTGLPWQMPPSPQTPGTSAPPAQPAPQAAPSPAPAPAAPPPATAAVPSTPAPPAPPV